MGIFNKIVDAFFNKAKNSVSDNYSSFSKKSGLDADTNRIIKDMEDNWGHLYDKEKVKKHKPKNKKSKPFVSIFERQYNARFAEYIKVYDEETSKKLANQEIWVGMSAKMLILVKGEPYEISSSVLKDKSKDIYYYEKSKNRLGNIAYKFEVILENNSVIGWKDRENRGTKGR
jgi:hypothetical protein